MVGEHLIRITRCKTGENSPFPFLVLFYLTKLYWNYFFFSIRFRVPPPSSYFKYNSLVLTSKLSWRVLFKKSFMMLFISYFVWSHYIIRTFTLWHFLEISCLIRLYSLGFTPSETLLYSLKYLNSMYPVSFFLRSKFLGWFCKFLRTSGFPYI